MAETLRPNSQGPFPPPPPRRLRISHPPVLTLAKKHAIMLGALLLLLSCRLLHPPPFSHDSGQAVQSECSCLPSLIPLSRSPSLCHQGSLRPGTC